MPELTPQQQHVRERDSVIISHVITWLYWPWLPMKRKNPNGDARPELGFLKVQHASAKTGFRVYVCNLHTYVEMSAEQREAVKFEHYSSFEALFDAGWTVD